MAVRRPNRRSSRAVELSIDSLIDVFMNVLGVLMITAVVVALATPGTVAQKDQKQPEKVQPQESTQEPQRQSQPAVQLSLPQVELANTDPLYMLLTSEGIRAFTGADLSLTQQYFTVLELGDSIRLAAIPGRVMGVSEIRTWLRSFNPSFHHVTAVITPGGVGYYRELRRVAAAEGFRSGWMDHDSDIITIGSSGRSGALVQ
jgi:hypothetical protein